jgi:hypothetical protein
VLSRDYFPQYFTFVYGGNNGINPVLHVSRGTKSIYESTGWSGYFKEVIDDGPDFDPCYSGITGTLNNRQTWTFCPDEGILTVDGTKINNGTECNGFRQRSLHYHLDNIKNIVIGQNTTSIGDCAFYESENLISVTVPNSVTRIGNSAFRGCSNLTDITILNGTIFVPSGIRGW